MSLFECFGRQSESGKQLHVYFDHYLAHCRCRRDPCIYIKTTKETFDRLEQVGEWVEGGFDVLSHLVRLVVTRILTMLENGTYIK
jgi:hypothetical protein